MTEKEILLERLARKNDMTVEEMREHLDKRLEVGLNDPDSRRRSQWEKIPCVGESPTVEEWLEYVVKRIYEESREDLLKEYFIEEIFSNEICSQTFHIKLVDEGETIRYNSDKRIDKEK